MKKSGHLQEQEPKIDLKSEYDRLSEKDEVYQSKVIRWRRLRKLNYIFLVVSIILLLVSGFTSPKDTSFLELLPDNPLPFFSMIIGFCLMLLAGFISPFFVSRKLSRINDEFELKQEERIYLCAYRTHKNVNSVLDESDEKRKTNLRKLALKSVLELTEAVDKWHYGNIGLVKNLVAGQFSLLKDNIRRLILSNVAIGDETALRRISEILLDFCNYIVFPSITKIEKLNTTINELTYKEYKVLTTTKKISGYFYGRPRMFRLFFAFIVATVVALIGCGLQFHLEIIFAATVTAFWGAIAGFDKIFRLKEQ